LAIFYKCNFHISMSVLVTHRIKSLLRLRSNSYNTDLYGGMNPVLNTIF
jgi:hypothetical protein